MRNGAALAKAILAIAVAAGSVSGASAGTASDDAAMLAQAQYACANEDFRKLWDAFVQSPSSFRRNSTVETLLRGDSNAPSKIDRDTYLRDVTFPIARMNGFYISGDSVSRIGKTPGPDFLEVQIYRQKGDVYIVDWVRVAYRFPQAGYQGTPRKLYTYGRPGKLVFRQRNGCWQLEADLLGPEPKGRTAQ